MKNPSDKDGSQDQLEKFVVFDKFEIGPIKIEKKKISALYTIYKKDFTDSIDLIYSYEEEVFDPKDEADLNLASMILKSGCIKLWIVLQKNCF